MLFDQFRLDFTPQTICALLKLDEDFVCELESLVEKTLEIAKPKVLVKKVTVTKCAEGIALNGVPIKSRLAEKWLGEKTQAFCCVGTCGVELENLAQTYADPLTRYWQECINEYVLTLAMHSAQQQTRARYDLKPLSTINPGSHPDWPLSGQETLFAILGDVEAKTGVTLDGAYWMHPIKSGSGVWFESEKQKCNCQVCTRQNCRNRRAPFDKAQHLDIFGSEHFVQGAQ